MVKKKRNKMFLSLNNVLTSKVMLIILLDHILPNMGGF